MEKISPKKYIETKVRKLPVYKCLITSAWEELNMANVMVMRKHITGNVTVGYYLVDLLCLGVKDTFYHFNVPEEEAIERFGDTFEFMEETDYNLAHNVIYAAYEFAMEFDIPPHKDFKLTRYILEEDDDNIPLIDIHTGAEDGKPHLIINPMGQGKWALEKLIKNAGEGNYYYSTEDDLYDEDDDEFDEESPMHGLSLGDFSIGSITALMARNISLEEINNTEKLELRTENEIVSFTIESVIRAMDLTDQSTSGRDFFETEEYELTEMAVEEINYNNNLVYLDDLDEEGSIDQELAELSKLDGSKFNKKAEAILWSYPDNLFAVSKLYQYLLMQENQQLRDKICVQLSGLADDYPYAKLILAFNSAYFNIPDIRYSNIIYSSKIQDCFAGCSIFGEEELLVYWLIKVLKSINDNKLTDTAFYYKLAVNTCMENVMFWLTQQKLMIYFSENIPTGNE